jgi:predicted MFS family arabinose efflux permease
MILLALLLCVRSTSGSFVTAGAVSAAFAVAVACTAPVLGRLVDVRGQTTVLVATSVVHPLALTSVMLAASRHLAAPVVLAAAALAGASLPPLSACMRALWPALLEDADLRETAFGIEAVVIEICELAGPLLVGALTAVVSPAAAVVASGALTGVGALLFASAPASRTSRRALQTRRWRGPLAEAGVRWLLGIIALSTAGLAAFEVAVAAFATAHGSAASSGTLLALWFAGSLGGGWFYGARRWRPPAQTQLVWLLVLVSLGGLLPLLAAGPWTMAPLLLVAGVAIAPAIAVQLSLMSEVAPERSRTEAFTWASTANFLGIAAGAALAGFAVDRLGVSAGLIASAALAAATAFVAFAGRHGLGLPGVDLEAAAEAAEDAYDLAVFTDLADERDAALAALVDLGARNVALLAELEELRCRLEAQSPPEPLTAVPAQAKNV